jgi:hypothetical protein
LIRGFLVSIDVTAPQTLGALTLLCTHSFHSHSFILNTDTVSTEHFLTFLFFCTILTLDKATSTSPRDPYGTRVIP